VAGAVLASGIALVPDGAGTPAVAATAPGYRCGTVTAPARAAGDTEVRNSWAAWRSTYVTSAGAGGNLRVRRTENSDDTVSEGIAYGMLAAAYLGDRSTFDGLWRYAKAYRNGNGLMHWRIDASGRVTGQNGATDADVDMALALVRADTTWGGYRADTTALLGAILRHEVEPGTNVLKPGDVWGGSAITNPSYFAPAWFEVFRTYTGDARWGAVTDKAYELLTAVGTRTGSGRTGLVPDWMTASGERVAGYGYDHGYDATRTSWRVATHAAWTCDARATAHTAKVNAFFAGVGATNIRDGYTLDGRVTGQWHNASFVGPAASAAVLSPDAAYRAATWSATVRTPTENYYNASLRLLSLLFMSGNLGSPLAAGAPTPDPTTTSAVPTTTTTTPAPAPTTTTTVPSPTTTVPVPTPTTTTTAPAAPPAPGGCTVSYVVRDRWQGGYVAEVTVTNRGQARSGWTLRWTFPDGAQRITNAWNATATQSGAEVTVANAAWNGTLATGASATFGFQATAGATAATPAAFTLDGTRCSS
jgi:endo-1,4-beta-D-glucanase Y